MALKTKEITFETEIEYSLIEKGGYIKGNPADYSRECAIDTTLLFRFLCDSQPKEWDKLVIKHGVTNAKVNFLKRLNKELEAHGMLHLLRKGIVDSPAKFSLCYFQPSSSMNKTDVENYAKNILSITRQVHYSLKNENSIDIILFINGLPIITLELKNPITGQTVENAKRQYKYDRDSRELLLGFKSRCLVHFAVDTDEVYMTTKLSGLDTYFLPFNKGNSGGKGNPVGIGNYRTSYLWDEVLQKDSLLDIIHRFIHLEKKPDEKGKQKETIIFPRYHQLDVVRKLVANVKETGTGSNYLIQHSAGSGKSNSIAWLAHHLQNLHGEDNKIIFNSVIVITDRLVLDKQLQDTIYQFEQVEGVVQKIDNNSTQLANALNTGKKVIITTLQKFPFIVEKVRDLSGKHFAVIVDEAHSSQTGEAARKLKAVIGDEYAGLSEDERLQKIADEEAKEEKNVPDSEDEIAKEMATHGKLKNLSFFAFTATPKAKTLEMFGASDESGLPRAFHVYSMRQAIEEGFILDVLKNYMTYETYFKIGKAIADDPRYEKSKANKALGKFLSLHPHNLAQKTQIIIEHFRSVTKDKIGGKAKAMVVTGSRLHAVRYYFEFENYIKKMGYQKELGILVAFSGTVYDTVTGESKEYTEYGINKIKETELPKKFHGGEYQVLLVAEKYQTGFDEPLLHTMFVDKKLHGVKAVQTLSRLNRTCFAKEDTFVLDFVNSSEDIKASFAPYYEESTVEETTDANIVYDLKTQLDEYRIYWESEVENFAKIFFKPTKKSGNMDFGVLNSYLDPAVDRYKGKAEEEQSEFKSTITKFIRTYSFVSNIVKLDDSGMHKFFAYAKCLLRKLPHDDSGKVDLDDEVMLQYYRVQKIFEGSIGLEKGDPLPNTKFAGQSKKSDEESMLSELIDKLNERFGTDFDPATDKVLEQIVADMEKDNNLRTQAKNNSKEHFKFPFNDAFLGIVVDRMTQNKAFCEKVLDDEKFGGMVKELLVDYVYERLRA